VLLGVLAWLIYQIAQRVAGAREAHMAAFACVLYLPFVWLTNMELTETLATVLCAAVLLMLIEADRP